MLPDLAPILDQRRFLTIAHHVPGRIRIKFDMTALARLPNIDPAPFADLIKRIRGVKTMRINAAALTLVVDYDCAEIPSPIWARLLVADKAEIEEIFARRLS
ncbi:conserved hypothetical protein [Methylocella silvestris BL2]|uniref:Cation transporter n=1 Tax=Methylocella silvestris (strain DSM 15510 / CIP 108128 / LMG 27833 / NCIMB 13906 / BL2) TaxID=395965 RepID=B8EIK7_METSB|nr:hypothetical protein [Methylocella silvestris]ACK51824.1 conserved hypothetical protein [Methylocella silvestris BL2]